MFRVITRTIQTWIASQIKDVAKEVFSPEVMRIALEQMRTEFKKEVRNYRRSKEEEMTGLMKKNDLVVDQLTTLRDLTQDMKLENHALWKVMDMLCLENGENIKHVKRLVEDEKKYHIQ